VRNRGVGRILSQAQEGSIQRTIIDKRPEQLKMDFFFWSRAAVGLLIEQEYDIKLHVRSVGKYLKRWGFTPPKADQACLRAKSCGGASLAGG
jgi:transposase